MELWYITMLIICLREAKVNPFLKKQKNFSVKIT